MLSSKLLEDMIIDDEDDYDDDRFGVSNLCGWLFVGLTSPALSSASSLSRAKCGGRL